MASSFEYLLDSVSLRASFLISSNFSVSSPVSSPNIYLLTTLLPKTTLSNLSRINSVFGSFKSLFIDNLFAINLLPAIPAANVAPPTAFPKANAGLVVIHVYALAVCNPTITVVIPFKLCSSGSEPIAPAFELNLNNFNTIVVIFNIDFNTNQNIKNPIKLVIAPSNKFLINNA